MEIVAITDCEKQPSEKWIFTVEIQDEKGLDIKLDAKTGLCYVMQNHDGSTVYDLRTGKTLPDYPFSEKTAIDLVQCSYQTGNARFLEDCLTDIV